MQSLQTFLSGNHGLFSINQEPVSFTNVMTAQVQWAMANYLLAKNNVSYMYMTGYQEYGYLYLRPEYSAPIGSATDTMYQSQNVYMRDFTKGKVIVNPSSSQSYMIALPQNTYQDLYGNAINSLTLGPGSGIVLVRAPTPFYRVDAESMTLLGRAYVIGDSAASGGQAVEAWTTGDGVSGSASFATAGTYTFTFGGREDYHNGDAHLSLYLDGSSTAVGGVYVTNTNGYPTYTITVAVSAGTHSFRLVFDNDFYGYSGPGGDRNAYINYVAIAAPSTP
jgi:hypothetical protein